MLSPLLLSCCLQPFKGIVSVKSYFLGAKWPLQHILSVRPLPANSSSLFKVSSLILNDDSRLTRMSSDWKDFCRKYKKWLLYVNLFFGTEHENIISIVIKATITLIFAFCLDLNMGPIQDFNRHAHVQRKKKQCNFNFLHVKVQPSSSSLSVIFSNVHFHRFIFKFQNKCI